MSKIRTPRKQRRPNEPPSSPKAVQSTGNRRRWLLLIAAGTVAAAVLIAGLLWRAQRGTEEQAKREAKQTLQQRAKPLPAPQYSPPAPASTPQEEVSALKREAVQIADRLIKEFPDQPDSFSIMGTVCVSQGNSAKAMGYWERCLELDPNRPDIYYGMSWYELQSGEYEKAAALARKALELDPKMPGIRHHLACTIMFLGRMTDAIALLEKEVELFPKAVESYYRLGQAQQQLKEYEKAKKNFEAAMQIQPDHKKACYGLTTVCARLGQMDEAKRYREKFEKMKDDDVRILINDTTSFNDLASVRQKVAATHTDAGMFYAQQGQLSQAEQHWRRAAALDPKDTGSRSCLVSMYLQTNSKLPQAKTLAEKVVELDPSGKSYVLLSGACEKTGDTAGALSALKRAVELEPDREEYRRMYREAQQRK